VQLCAVLLRRALVTFRASFEHFRDRPEMLAMSWPAYALARRERERGWFRTKLEHMVHPGNTTDLRGMVEDLRHWSPAKDEKISAGLTRVREQSGRVPGPRADAEARLFLRTARVSQRYAVIHATIVRPGASSSLRVRPEPRRRGIRPARRRRSGPAVLLEERNSRSTLWRPRV
jgi:hypothetical protein